MKCEVNSAKLFRTLQICCSDSVQLPSVSFFVSAVSAEYAASEWAPSQHTDSINIVRLSLESLNALLNFDQLFQKQFKEIAEFK